MICAIDITIKSGNFKFDILNDVIGMILITTGVFRLARIDAPDSYRKAMGLVKLVCVIATIKTFVDQWTFEKSHEAEALWSAWEFAEIAAILLFCFAMRLLCTRMGLEGPTRSWRTTSTLFVIFFALPVGGLHAFLIFRALASHHSSVDIGALGLLFLLVIFIPMIHLFVSTSRMKRAAEAAGEEWARG